MCNPCKTCHDNAKRYSIGMKNPGWKSIMLTVTILWWWWHCIDWVSMLFLLNNDRDLFDEKSQCSKIEVQLRCHQWIQCIIPICTWRTIPMVSHCFNVYSFFNCAPLGSSWHVSSEKIWIFMGYIPNVRGLAETIWR